MLRYTWKASFFRFAYGTAVLPRELRDFSVNLGTAKFSTFFARPKGLAQKVGLRSPQVVGGGAPPGARFDQILYSEYWKQRLHSLNRCFQCSEYSIW